MDEVQNETLNPLNLLMPGLTEFWKDNKAFEALDKALFETDGVLSELSWIKGSVNESSPLWWLNQFQQELLECEALEAAPSGFRPIFLTVKQFWIVRCYLSSNISLIEISSSLGIPIETVKRVV